MGTANAALASEIATRASADQNNAAATAAEVVARTSAIAAQVDALAVEAAARAAGDQAQGVASQQASSALATALLLPSSRIGDNPFLFTPGLPFSGAVAPPLPAAGCVLTSIGTVYRVTGAATIAMRRTVLANPSRVNLVRFSYRRFAAPTNPSNDSVRMGIAWLDQNGVLLGTTPVRTDQQPAVSAGLTTYACRVPSQAGDPVSVVIPAGCVSWRPFEQSFGLDGVTDFVEIATSDITDAAAYSPDMTATNARVTTLEGEFASLSPLAAGTVNGLATLDSTGTIIQLPPLKAAWIQGALAFVPNASAALDAAIGQQPSAALTIDHYRNPYVRVGSAWATFAQAALGLTAAQGGHDLRGDLLAGADQRHHSADRAVRCRYQHVGRSAGGAHHTGRYSRRQHEGVLRQHDRRPGQRQLLRRQRRALCAGGRLPLWPAANLPDFGCAGRAGPHHERPPRRNSRRSGRPPSPSSPKRIAP